MTASRLSKELTNTLIRVNRCIIVTIENFLLDILLLIDQSFSLLCLLLALHVTSDFGLHARVSLNRTPTALFLSSGADLDVSDRLTDKLCALVLFQILTSGALGLVHHAKAALQGQRLLHLGLLNVGLRWGPPSTVLHRAFHCTTHLVFRFNFDRTALFVSFSPQPPK